MTAAVASRCISSCVAFFAGWIINAITTGFKFAVIIAAVAGACVAIVAGLPDRHVFDPISACLVRLAVVAAAISVEVVTIVADFAFI